MGYSFCNIWYCSSLQVLVACLLLEETSRQVYLMPTLAFHSTCRSFTSPIVSAVLWNTRAILHIARREMELQKKKNLMWGLLDIPLISRSLISNFCDICMCPGSGFSLFMHYPGMHLDLSAKFGEDPLRNHDVVSRQINKQHTFLFLLYISLAFSCVSLLLSHKQITCLIYFSDCMDILWRTGTPISQGINMLDTSIMKVIAIHSGHISQVTCPKQWST